MAVLYFFIDPSESRFLPRCLFHELTGWKCPGCGSQRMLHALLHGNLTEAWRQNAMLLCAIPMLIPMTWLELRRKDHPRLYTRLHSTLIIAAIAAAMLLWWLLRNIFNW